MRLGIAFTAALLALPASPAHSLTVDEVIAKNVEARGGLAKIEAIKSLRATGKVVLGGGQFSIEAGFGLLQKRPGMMRSETTIQGLTAVEAFDGQEGSYQVERVQTLRRELADVAKEFDALSTDLK
jgi:hypothetical protein